MKYWIQRADFSAVDREAPDADQFLAVLEKHDWASELRYRAVLEQAHAEWCDPGLGIVPEDGRLLHLCPQEDGSISCHYKFMKQRRMLGITYAQTPVLKTSQLSSMAQAPEVIRLFLANDHDALSRQFL